VKVPGILCNCARNLNYAPADQLVPGIEEI
jgi:hypothetical protein